VFRAYWPEDGTIIPRFADLSSIASVPKVRATPNEVPIMKRDSLHPLRLLPVLGSTPRNRLDALEPVIERWFTEDFRSHDDPPVHLEPDYLPRMRRSHGAAVEEAVSWSTVPDSGESIPDTEQ
jgi:hypothetical protein